MACASQSALDYVRSARDHLVRTLKGFTEVVEKLSTRGFFSEEDVNKIKSESDGFDKTRRIVDYVIEKGEEACYEFLRIIDKTRRTSGERSVSFAESSSSLSNMFDLNYWISCFSFREDINMDVTSLQGPSPCHRYQQKLKSEAQKISERSWTQSKAVLFNKQSSLSYTSLVLDTQGQASPSKIKKSKIKKSRKLRPKKLKMYIPEDKHGTSPSELLKTYERKILLVGKPGTGKTAVVHQMLKLWSEKDNRDLDYMFYFDMRETPNITELHKLDDLLFSVFCEPDEGKDEVLEDMKDNADSVTIIFDGVTDVGSTSVVFKLIQKTLLPEAKIIITCRPEVESADFLLDWDCLRVEVKGFSEQSIREYLSKNLSEDHFNKVLCNLELFSLCHVPMYALMVVACFSFEGSDFSPHPCTVTEIYLNILHFCNQRNVSKTSENESTKWDAILSLSQAAFCATEGKNVNLTSLPKLDSCANLAILSRNVIQVSPTVRKPLCAFLHYTVQEFFAALWVLKDPEKTRCVLQQCLVQGNKHMKHLVPFLCGLLNEKNTDLLESLLPPQQLRDTSDWFFKHLVTTFVGCSDSEDCEMDLMFLCQCLYESQSPDACLCLLDKLDYFIDVSGETLDPQQCCVLAYVISQSKERKIELNLEDTTVSKQGMRPLLGCLSKLQRSDSLSRQLWTISLLTDGDVDYVSLLDFTENQLHLPVNSKTQLYDRAVRVLQERKRKVKVCLHCDHRVCQSASSFLLHRLPHIHSLRVDAETSDEDRTKIFVSLFCAAAEREQQTGEKILELLASVCTYQTFPLHERRMDDDDDDDDDNDDDLKQYRLDFLLDLYSHVKDCETKTGLSVLPSLQSVFQSAPAVWSIKLSERKTSILLEVLKLQPEKKQVELTGCSHEESEVRGFLQCLPYISQLSFGYDGFSAPREAVMFFGSLFCAVAEREQQTGEKILELLASLCTYQTFPVHERDMDEDDDYDLKLYRLDFLLDLCSHVKDYETKTGLSVLPSLQSVFQSTPAVWVIYLSERKTSILLEVLKVQPEKKQVELLMWQGEEEEESEVRSLLQCLPYISQLSFAYDGCSDPDEAVGFFVSLFCAAAEREQQTGEKILELLASVCTYQTFPLHEKYLDDGDDLKQYQSDFLLDLFSHMKDYESKTGLSVLPSLQSVFQSAPAVWSIDLSERKTSILLEVLKLQPEKKQVELTDFSHEESEVRSLLQCLPYISQLRVDAETSDEDTRIFVSLFCAAAEREQQTGEKILELLASVCRYQTFPLHERRMDDDDDLKQYRLDFLLDLYSHVKDNETKTGLSVLPSLQSVFQSAPAVWSIKLSERKTSILLEVLKLQPEKKQVELRRCSHEESEVRSLLQCLPYISQLSVDPLRSRRHKAVRIFVSLFCAAAEREQQTGEKILELLASVCTYQTFPLHERHMDDDDDDDDDLKQYQINFLLDLYSHVKDCETKTGLSVLPSLQSVFQSAPAVWSIKLSERKTSILLEVLKLQPEKKPVELRGCSHEESEVRSFLQCLPYISQL
uniref:NACHT domain-containing protein n=1 Tax=Oreochromis aureus TaxID=47969 RepID=A0AAZ1XXH9_OREAU